MNGRRVLLGVCGGIAAYKAAALASRLVQRGVELDVVLTADALHFVGEATFAALARRKVYSSMWDEVERIPHIALARDADVIVIAPATANTLAKMALGLADDLLTNIALATRAPIVVAPAMNSAMLEHPATAAHLATLRARGVHIVEPGTGFLAEREHGPGRLAEESDIIAAIEGVLMLRQAQHDSGTPQSLRNERIVITGGPTREAIDPVRFLSNASTGMQGIELARAAHARGAQVDLVLGPTHLEGPPGVNVIRVTTAQQMNDSVQAHASHATMLFATAAVADFAPAHVYEQKVKKTAGEPEAIALVRTPDVLANAAAHKGKMFVVGFAAETTEHERHAREKLVRKGLDAIVVNDVSGERGWGDVQNTHVLLWGADGRRELGTGSKAELSARLLDAVAVLRASTSSA
jgi:phosphopantothenoylcysteine decarboxylase/phosphopantothenate--cysteine ligase